MLEEKIATEEAFGLRIPAKITKNERLSCSDAEAIADRFRRQLGLGQAYHLHVMRDDDGNWELEDEQGSHAVRRPMRAQELIQWYTTRYADVISDRLETSEG